MFGLGMPELLVVLVIALLVFGANRLPDIGSSLGKAIRGFRESSERREPEGPESSSPGDDKACPHCGDRLAADAKTCARCGKAVDAG
jgi:sec-independent protein translocase protein TatA